MAEPSGADLRPLDRNGQTGERAGLAKMSEKEIKELDDSNSKDFGWLRRAARGKILSSSKRLVRVLIFFRINLQQLFSLLSSARLFF